MINNKIKDILLNNNGVSIINIDGSYLRKDKHGKLYYNTNEDIKFKNKDGIEITIKPTYEKIYTAKMVLSLETFRAFNKDELKNEIINSETNKPIDIESFNEKNKELYTKLFVNLKFEKNSIRFEENDENVLKKTTSKKDIRMDVYTKNIFIDGIEYTFFKRGGSKARTAQAIFVKKEYLDLLLKPCFLGLKFEKGNKYDVTSKEAYTSLIMSGIIDILHIDRDSILIINDLYSDTFKANQSLTVMKDDGSVVQEENVYDVINCTTDGQGLMDESIYLENSILNESTCVLLRNDFLKCNACRTKLQEYYKENNITKVWDMYRGWIDASKIKLVITPNSCKYLKFSNQFESEKECFLDWLEKIPEEFGIVKTDHEGNYGYSNRLSYQMINSMNLNKDEVRHLMRYELEYINLLINNSKYSKSDLKNMDKETKKEIKEKANEMSYFLNTIKNSNPLSSGDMASALVNWNSDYRFTREFKDFKKNKIQQYIKNLRTGAIRVKNSLYAIMISCPYEMLTSTHEKNNKVKKWIMDKNECYNPFFNSGKDLISIRNPQVNAGNVYWMKNKYREEYKWFGYQKNNINKHHFVVFVNTYNADLMNRLQGADFDIDTTFLSDDEKLVEKAKENEKWYTPTNGIKGTKEIRVYTNESLAELDNYLGKSTEYIGKIINKSAIFNAYMYDGINNGYSEDYIKQCYNASSTLSSFSQIAIDMAKKSFLDKNGDLIDLMGMMSSLNHIKTDNGENILKFITKIEVSDFNKRGYQTNNIKKLTYEYNEDLNKYCHYYELKTPLMVSPMFFKYTAQNNSNRYLVKMKCGMDYLEEIIDDIETRPITTKTIKIEDLICTKRDLHTDGKTNYSKIDNFRKYVCNCYSLINNVFINKKESKLIYYYKKRTLNEILKLKINKMTIYTLLLRIFNIDCSYNGKEIKINDIKIKELHSIKNLSLSMLYSNNNKYFLSCIKNNELKNNLKECNFWV